MPSVRPSVRPSFLPSVRPSFLPSVRPARFVSGAEHKNRERYLNQTWYIDRSSGELVPFDSLGFLNCFFFVFFFFKFLKKNFPVPFDSLGFLIFFFLLNFFKIFYFFPFPFPGGGYEYFMLVL